MKLKSVENANRRIEEIKKNRAKEEAEIAGKIQQAKEDMEKATGAIAAAVNSTDLTAYKRATAERDEARIKKEMYEARLDILKASALISEHEYNSLVSAIIDEVKGMEKTRAAEMAAISEQCAKAAAGLRSAQIDANKCLATLQHDVYRDADRTVINPSTRVYDAKSKKEIDVWDTITWLEDPIQDDSYTATTGKKVTVSSRPAGILIDGEMITG